MFIDTGTTLSLQPIFFPEAPLSFKAIRKILTLVAPCEIVDVGNGAREGSGVSGMLVFVGKGRAVGGRDVWVGSSRVIVTQAVSTQVKTQKIIINEICFFKKHSSNSPYSTPLL
jgi:hypothetical protein